MSMKKCTKYAINKDFYEFNKRSLSKDGLSAQCKECNKENLKSHYELNKIYYRDKAKKYKDAFKYFINTYKEDIGCSICGEKRHWVLDFHHTDDNKEFSISKLVNIQSYTKLKNEINKCIVVCSNCHRDIHYKERL